MYLNKISNIKLFQCDVQIQRNVTAPWYFPLVMLLCAEPKAKVTKETEKHTIEQIARNLFVNILVTQTNRDILLVWLLLHSQVSYIVLSFAQIMSDSVHNHAANYWYVVANFDEIFKLIAHQIKKSGHNTNLENESNGSEKPPLCFRPSSPLRSYICRFSLSDNTCPSDIKSLIFY